jgi:hypothetical protein
MFTLVIQGADAGTHDAYLHPVGELAGIALGKVQALAGSEVCPRRTCSKAQLSMCLLRLTYVTGQMQLTQVVRVMLAERRAQHVN